LCVANKAHQVKIPAYLLYMTLILNKTELYRYK